MKSRIRSLSVYSDGSLSMRSTTSPDTDRHTAKALFGPLLTMFKYSGIYIDRNQRHKGFLFYLHFVFCILFLLLITADNVRVFMYLGKDEGIAITGKTMVFASLMFFNIFLNFLSVAVLVANSLYLKTFLTEIAKYSTHYGLAFDVDKLKSKIRKSIICFVLSMGIGVPATLGFWVYLLNYWPGTIMEAFAYPFYTWPNLPRYFLTFVEIALRNALFIQFDSVCILHFIVCYIIWKEYNGINNKLKHIIDEQTYDEF